MTTPKGDDVVMVPDTMVGEKCVRYQVIADQERQGLRCKTPDLGTLDNVHPDPEIKVLLRKHMEFDGMTDEVITSWEILAEREAEEEEPGRVEWC